MTAVQEMALPALAHARRHPDALLELTGKRGRSTLVRYENSVALSSTLGKYGEVATMTLSIPNCIHADAILDAGFACVNHKSRSYLWSVHVGLIDRMLVVCKAREHGFDMPPDGSVEINPVAARVHQLTDSLFAACDPGNGIEPLFFPLGLEAARRAIRSLVKIVSPAHRRFLTDDARLLDRSPSQDARVFVLGGFPIARSIFDAIYEARMTDLVIVVRAAVIAVVRWRRFAAARAAAPLRHFSRRSRHLDADNLPEGFAHALYRARARRQLGVLVLATLAVVRCRRAVRRAKRARII